MQPVQLPWLGICQTYDSSPTISDSHVGDIAPCVTTATDQDFILAHGLIPFYFAADNYCTPGVAGQSSGVNGHFVCSQTVYQRSAISAAYKKGTHPKRR